MSGGGNNIAILCAGPGLGFYVPGLVMNRQLESEGLRSGVFVFESLLKKEKKDNILKAKEKFHADFSFALMGQNLTKDPSPFLDDAELNELFAAWTNGNYATFILLSGFWVPVMERYRALQPLARVILCHLDAANSTSWQLFQSATAGYDHVWFCNWEKTAINFHLPVTTSPPVPFEERQNRLIVHGGGWGMGTYQQTPDVLNKAGFDLDVIAYQDNDLRDMNGQNRYYLIDPAWKNWQANEMGVYQFPPVREIAEHQPDFNCRHDSPDVFHIIRRNKAIVSKPGAGTLIDSLSSLTPLVYLEPFGDYERKNSALWEHYGLGISFKEWEASGFSQKLLQEMHNNLASVKSKTQNFINYIISNGPENTP